MSRSFALRAFMVCLASLVALTGCGGGDDSAVPTREKASVPPSLTANTPSPSVTPSASPSKTAVEQPDDGGCGNPKEFATAEWETEDVPFPQQDVVRTRWSDADITGTLTNNSEHAIVVEFVLFFVRAPKGEQLKPKFPAYTSPSQDFDYANEVDPGDTFTAPGQPFGLRDWLEQFPLYSQGEPRVSVSFNWHFKDEDLQARCVDAVNRTQPVGKQARVLSSAPWVAAARFTRTGATVRYCASLDEDEVFDAAAFEAQAADGTTVKPTALDGRLKVPVAAGTCRNVRLAFPGVTSADWTLVYPFEDEKVPLRWTLASICLRRDPRRLAGRDWQRQRGV